MRNLPTLLKREYWEHPAFWVVPTIIFGILILSALGGYVQGVGGTVGFAHLVNGLEMVHEKARAGVIFMSFLGIAVLFSIAMTFVIFFYLLDALYSERKERHILFWKSMPVSDSETVVSKVLTASFVIPGFFLIGIFFTKLIFLMLSSIFIWIGGGSAIDLLWRPAPVFADLGLSLYYIVAAGLWMLPFTGWLLLSSSLAKKSRPFMWAVLAPLFVGIVEEIVLGTSHFVETIGKYIETFFETAFTRIGSGVHIEINNIEDLNNIDIKDFSLNNLIDPVGLLSSPALWIGLIIGSAFIAAAIWLRRYRDDS